MAQAADAPQRRRLTIDPCTRDEVTLLEHIGGRIAATRFTAD